MSYVTDLYRWYYINWLLPILFVFMLVIVNLVFNFRKRVRVWREVSAVVAVVNHLKFADVHSVASISVESFLFVTLGDDRGSGKKPGVLEGEETGAFARISCCPTVIRRVKNQ